MRTLEDDLWVYFGHPNEYWRNKCFACREKALELKIPVPECINCWKIEVWSQSPWFLDANTSPGITCDPYDAYHYEPLFRPHISRPHTGLLTARNPVCPGGRLTNGLDRMYLLAFKLAARTGAGFVAKISKHPLQVVSTGEPLSQYPDAGVDFLLMIYASLIKERDEIRQAICTVLGIDVLAAGTIPVRRGCWLYDHILGPWQDWHETDKDFETP